ncbi:LOW QUALITY PROTEIN: gag-asp_proteas domain-containing protein, partial [Cephalotus follicularis]
LQRRGVQDLAQAIAVAESLTEFRKSDPKPKSPKTGNSNKGEREKFSKDWQSQFRFKYKGKQPYGHKPKPKLACFLCDGPHHANECPKKGRLTALIQEEDQRREAKMGSFQFLNAVKAKVHVPKNAPEGTMFVETTIGGQPIKALVDTGATNNFISEDMGKRLCLKAYRGGYIKAVNSKAKPLIGIAKDVGMNIGEWNGLVSLSIIPMDDY